MADPKIRFKREDGSAYPNWMEQRFGDYIKAITEKTSDKTRYPLYSLTIEEGVVPKTDRYEREFLVTKEGDAYKVVPPNAFVYNPMNLRFGALKVNHSGISVSVSGYYDVFQMGSSATLNFWENYLVSPLMINWYNAIALGTLVEKKRVHYSQFIEIKKFLPAVEEQEKIASFFSDLDEVIAQSEDEVAALEKQKKGVMQKIFSQEIRFKQEDGSDYPKWREATIAEVCTPLQYGMGAAAKEYDGENHYIRITDIDDSSHRYICSDPVSPNGELDDKYLVKRGDILLARTGASTGKSYLYKPTDGKLYFAGFLIRAHVKSEYNPYFIYAQTLTYKYEKWVKTTSVRSGQPGINSAEYSSYSFEIPCLEEQQKIADFLLDFDTAIDLAKQEMEKWKQLKKGLMQQMFV